MYRKIVPVNLFSIVLASAFLIGSLPMSMHMSSMHMDGQTISVIAVSETNITSGNMNSARSESCCDVICPFSIFLVPQTVYGILYGDNKQVVNSNPVIQLIYLESIAPPPKA